MKSKSLIILFTAFCSLSVLAQTNTQSQPQRESKYVDFSGFKGKIFELKNRDPRELLSILEPLGSGFKGAIMQPDSEMKTLTVRDFPENIAALEEAIKRLDVPKPSRVSTDPHYQNMELHLHILLASNIEGASNAHPNELKDVLKQLQETMAYKNYYLVSSMIQKFRAISGFENEGAITAGQPLYEKPATANSRLKIGQILFEPTPNEPTRMHLNGFEFSTLDHAGVFGNTLIRNKLTLRDGEKLVVGTANLKDKALVLVLSLKVIK
jgi:hypothetical protein